MTFVPNPLFIPELERSLAMRAATRISAEVVQGLAERFGQQIGAPWLPRKSNQRLRKDGQADRRFKRRDGTFIVVQQGDEAAVVNTDHLGHIMEWGGAHNPPHAPLRRAVRAAGLHLK